jgi:hypothetical protein
MNDCPHNRTKIEAYDLGETRRILTSCGGCGELLSNRAREIRDFDELTRSQDAWNQAYAERHGWRKP